MKNLVNYIWKWKFSILAPILGWEFGYLFSFLLKYIPISIYLILFIFVTIEWYHLGKLASKLDYHLQEKHEE